MNKLLSIIIPTYNMEKYLQRCLDSLIVHENNLHLLEVLVINDGSKDSSSIIGHEYEKKYPETFRVIDKENGNYGSCINCGLKVAHGKYVKILDADDYYAKENFEKFMLELSTVDADMIFSDMSYVGEKTTNANINKYFPQRQVINIDSNNSPELPIYKMHTVCYRTSLLRDINYRQTEGISYTDQEWIFFPLFYVKTIYYIPFNIYQYCIGREGQTMNPQTMMRCLEHSQKIAKRVFCYYEDFDKSTLSKTKLKAIKDMIRYHFYFLYRMYLKRQGPNYDRKAITSIDSLLKTDHELYDEIGRCKYHRFLPIPYIKIWRETGKRVNMDFLQKIKSFFSI